MPRGFSDASAWPPRPAATATLETKPFPSTGPHGHRRRMRERLLERGGAGLADYELLEMLFFFGFPGGDTKPLAKATINRFGGLAAALSADADTLKSIPEELSEDCVQGLLLVQDAANRLAAADRREAPILTDWLSLQEYLRDLPELPLRVLYLDNKNRLLMDEAAPSPHLDAPRVRAILRRALGLHAVSVLLAASRADPTPTLADRDALRRLRAAGEAVTVTAHDLVLLSGDRLISVQHWC
ncbi:MAG TPA: JAB domain-containing protein [Acetobacteraceae bacterium]|nr:JAB domain-containing protein [Acetobacteraceae bacterium]